MKPNFILPELFCSLSDIARRPPAQAQHQVDFLDTLLDKVVCQQLLPQAVAPALKPYGISLSFKSRISIPKPPYAAFHGLNLSYASAEIIPTISHSSISSSLVVTPGSKIAHVQNEISLDRLFSQLKSDVHVRLLFLLKLLKHVFSAEAYAIAIESSSAHHTPLVNLSKIVLRFDIAVFSATSIPDILARLISDGLDLSSLNPFLQA